MSSQARPSPLFLVCDCGGTSTRAGIANSSGEIIARGIGGASNAASAGYDAALESVQRAIEAACADFGGDEPLPLNPWPFEASWIGMAGLDTPASLPIARKAFTSRFGLDMSAHAIQVTNDAHLLSAAIARSPHENMRNGIAVIAGTGSIAMAFRIEARGELPQELGRAGGWGHLLSDEGSAWNVGREALRRTLAIELEERPGQPPPRAFVANLLSHFGSPSIEDLLDYAVGLDADVPSAEAEALRKSRICDLARLVQAYAYPDEARWPANGPIPIRGKPHAFAVSILEDAAGELRSLVSNLCRRYRIAREDICVVITGGMFTSPGFRKLFLDAIGSPGALEMVTDPVAVAAIALARRYA